MLFRSHEDHGQCLPISCAVREELADAVRARLHLLKSSKEKARFGTADADQKRAMYGGSMPGGCF